MLAEDPKSRKRARNPPHNWVEQKEKKRERRGKKKEKGQTEKGRYHVISCMESKTRTKSKLMDREQTDQWFPLAGGGVLGRRSGMMWEEAKSGRLKEEM